MPRRATPITPYRGRTPANWSAGCAPAPAASRTPCAPASSCAPPTGATNSAIAAEVGVARHTVQHWRDRFAADRLAGLADRPHQPDPRQYGPDIQAQVVVLACQTPADLGWDGPDPLDDQGPRALHRRAPRVGPGRAQQEHGPSHPPGARPAPGPPLTPGWRSATRPSCPRRSRSSSCSCHPPADGPTFCVDEKTGIGVRDARPRPASRSAPGRPARREFEYVRHGTAAVLAAFDVRTGAVQAIVRRRHRSAEFIELLRLLDRQVPTRPGHPPDPGPGAAALLGGGRAVHLLPSRPLRVPLAAARTPRGCRSSRPGSPS